MLTLRIYMLQRISALIMVPLVIGHIAVMVYAIEGGLTVSEILGRTKGSFAWFAFYGLFVIAVSIHGAIGLRVILHEIIGLKDTVLSALTWLIGLGLLLMGLNAVWSVTYSGSLP
ncbi:MAG: succinate dehydrogenase [Pseudomonadota bacterium]